jgi:hypothetical protein
LDHRALVAGNTEQSYPIDPIALRYAAGR